MQIRSIGYLGMDTPGLGEWEGFARRVLACETSAFRWPGGTAGLALRIDEKSHRVLLRESSQEGPAFFGLEVADAEALRQAATELAAAGVAVTAGTAEEIDVRGVSGMLHVKDPAGYRVELYHGLRDAGTPFAPGRPMGGFRTGSLGFGHVVLLVPQLEASRDFYCDVLGFRVSDYILTPNRRAFLHTNERHHSIGLAERNGFGIAHFMFEVNELDDVGRAYDIAQEAYPDWIFSTLGRHSNDHMLSFYVQSPGKVPIEYGWGGRLVDDSTWQVSNVFGPSLWGHDRAGSAPDARAAADAQRRYAAEHGLRARIQVLPNNAAFDLEKL